ncbi:MAG: hypothetical protein KIT56_01770 [Gammaproteobacteria bacterium]|nr:hypothetical protein [Gammaproteobacteria bacterium]MCW5582612.1 hypothetical protein [Gammaproteobacteria bacterium]
MYNKQVSSWVVIAPQQAITNLIDSDEFSLNREVQPIESTGLFSSFWVADNQKRIFIIFLSMMKLMLFGDIIFMKLDFITSFHHFFIQE